MNALLPETPTPPLRGEPPFASIKTPLPGPQSEALRARHGAHMDARTVFVYQDAARSHGNYLVDVDGNTFLDIYGHIACIPIGYDHPALIEAWKCGRFEWASKYRPALGVAPPYEWVDLVERALMRMAPPGLDRVLTVTTGAEAVENAIKLAFVRHMAKRRKGPPSSAELSDVMHNRQEAANRLKIISFEGGFHGRTLGALSATRSKAIHKLDFPAFDWPMVPFPASRFPLAEHADDNAAAEASSLGIVEELLRAHPDEIAGILIEPIQGEGGDRHASREFFRALRKLASTYDVAFIVDEVQTGGGATGLFWAHEHWELDEPPDLVTWSKKLQVGGVHYRESFFPKDAYRIFNTFLGDPLRVAQLEVILDVIDRDQLLANTHITGQFLVNGLVDLCERYPRLISGARGVGTHAAFDAPDGAMRDQIIDGMRAHGLFAGGSGTRSVRFRPALVFGPRHAAEALDHLDSVLGSFVPR